jgi:FkbM family methyltransferase
MQDSEDGLTGGRASDLPPSEWRIEDLLNLPEIETLVPEAEAIRLRAYYPHMRGYYAMCEPQTKRWCVRNIGRDWRIFDVGANIGYYAVLFSRCAREGRVIAFEPTETALMMQRNLALNGSANVAVLQLALGAEAGNLHAAVYRIWGEEPEQRSYAFSTVDLEVRRLNMDRLDLLKIDVDSFDFDVLKGAIETLDRFDPWVLIELNHALAKRGSGVGEVLDWLAEQGYAEAHVLDRENFLLKRHGRRQRAAKPSISLTFDSEPVYMVPLLEKTGSPAAEVDESVKAMGVGVLSEDGGAVTIAGSAWNYGAGWAVRPLRGGPAVVEIRLRVRGGDIGVLCVDASLSHVLGKEVFVSPGVEASVEISLENVADLRAIVIRKGPDIDRPVEVSFTSPSVWAAKTKTADLPPLSLNPAVGKVPFSDIAQGLRQPASSIPAGELEIVNIDQLGRRLGSDYAFRPPMILVHQPVSLFQMEHQDSRILAQMFRMHAPRHHLEFGTWEGFGAALCALNCDAHIWTVNLPEGERDERGQPLYADGSGISDAGDRIGRLYRAAGYAGRVTQLLMDSRDLDIGQFGPGFFDSILIDGGHTADVVASDTAKSITLLRPGGLMMWHDFCPDPQAIFTQEAAQGVVAAVLANWPRWRPCFDALFWIRPSWILLGVRNGVEYVS